MLGGLKIKTALIICSAFIFRILFVNIGIISSLNTIQNAGIIKSHFSSIIKKRKQVDAKNSNGNSAYVVAEICEEDSNEEKEIKSNPLLLIQILYSFIASKIETSLKNTLPLSDHFAFFSSKKHLVLQVIRI